MTIRGEYLFFFLGGGGGGGGGCLIRKRITINIVRSHSILKVRCWHNGLRSHILIFCYATPTPLLIAIPDKHNCSAVTGLQRTFQHTALHDVQTW